MISKNQDLLLHPLQNYTRHPPDEENDSPPVDDEGRTIQWQEELAMDPKLIYDFLFVL